MIFAWDPHRTSSVQFEEHECPTTKVFLKVMWISHGHGLRTPNHDHEKLLNQFFFLVTLGHVCKMAIRVDEHSKSGSSHATLIIERGRENRVP